MPIYLIIVTATVILAYQQMDFSNLFPIASSDTGVMADSAIKLFTFPFAETVLFLTITKSLKKSQSPYKIYMIGLLIGGAVMLIVFFRNLFVLGGPTMESELFPSYTTIRIVRVGTFLQRLESTISSNFYLGGITKIAVCLFGASIGTAKLLGIKG
ncbi:MAG TPA: spore gernimation protein, partial [Ruminococcaceae bacterium]|nr:spore gernimation protein [Oscillospiraceae bacterium]